MSLDRKILERIERENIRIRPKWFFAVKDFVFGAGTILISILGSVSLALLFDVAVQQGKSMTWLSAPYLLAALFVIFLVGGYWLVTKIDSLYRVRFVPIMGMLLCISLSFGYLTFANGKAGEIRLELEKIPIHEAIVPTIKVEVPEADKKTRSDQKEQGDDMNDEDEEEQKDHDDGKDPSDSEEDDSEVESWDEEDYNRNMDKEEDGVDDTDRDELQKDEIEKEEDDTEDDQSAAEDDDQKDENTQENESAEDPDEGAGDEDVVEAEDSEGDDPEETNEA